MRASWLCISCWKRGGSAARERIVLGQVPQVSFKSAALGDVLEERVEVPAILRVQWRDRQLDGQLVSVAVQRLDLSPAAEKRPLSAGEETLEPFGVPLAMALGDHRIRQRAAEHFLT